MPKTHESEVGKPTWFEIAKELGKVNTRKYQILVRYLTDNAIEGTNREIVCERWVWDQLVGVMRDSDVGHLVEMIAELREEVPLGLRTRVHRLENLADKREDRVTAALVIGALAIFATAVLAALVL